MSGCSVLKLIDNLTNHIDSCTECKTEDKESMTSRGAFIVFEGIDRCGKSSQCKLLLRYLERNKISNKFYQFPNRESLTGKIINDYLTNKIKVLDHRCIHLLFAANRHEAKTDIIEDLNNGINIICDRYCHSGIAYSSSHIKQAKLSMKWCKSSDSGLPKPDCILYLNLSVDDAQKRGNFGDERYEQIEFQKRVKCAFDEIIENEQNNKNEYTQWNIINANNEIETIHKEIVEIANKTINEKKKKIIDFYCD